MAQAAGDLFEALGDPTRREILRLLGTGGRPVQEIARRAADQPSRRLAPPGACSKRAGLVAERAEGTRRIYALREEGLHAVQTYLEGVWERPQRVFGCWPRTRPTRRSGDRAAAARLRRGLPAGPGVRAVDQPDRHLVAAPDHTVTGLDDLEIVLERRVGGRIYERTPDGEEHDWGRVTAWEPPTALRYAWHLGGDLSQATRGRDPLLGRRRRVDQGRDRARGWERLGARADAWRERNRKGWDTLLPHYDAAVEGGSG